MFYPSFAVLALSVSAALSPAAASGSPIKSPIHLHPHLARAGDAIYISVYNSSFSFRDIEIAGHIYTVSAHSYVTIKAPAGTAIYAASPGRSYRRGDAIFVIAPSLKEKRITLD